MEIKKCLALRSLSSCKHKKRWLWVWTWMRWMLPEMTDWLLNCPYTGAWWENELNALGKWLELQLLPLRETGFCSACSSRNARLEAAMFGDGLVLVTSGDISCFRQSAWDWRGSEVVTGRVRKIKANDEHEWNLKTRVTRQQQTESERSQGCVRDADSKTQHVEDFVPSLCVCVWGGGSKGIIAII